MATARKIVKALAPIIALGLLLFCIVYVKDTIHPHRRDRAATLEKNFARMRMRPEQRNEEDQKLLQQNAASSTETPNFEKRNSAFNSTSNLIPKHNSNRPFRTSEGLLLLLLLLCACFIFGHILHKTGFTYLHETGISIILGIIASILLRYSYTPEKLDDMIAFSHDIFFIILLPPIIFESGYNMKRKMFFKNIGSLTAFALAGTVISTAVIAIILLIAEAAGANLGLTRLDNFIFGSLISATDPVSVLAIFKAMQADQNLFANVFGESVLNDAVAIVLYETCITFVDNEVNINTVFIAIGFFFLVFVGSLVIGVIFALLCALMFKYVAFYHNAILEASIQVIFAYLSYLLADALSLSGIVSILFCGIAMAHYTRANLSTEGKQFTGQLWAVWAMLTETFVFLYLGLAAFSFGHLYNPGFMFVALFSIFPARAANVFPISAIVNRTRQVNKIPTNHQVMIWFSGLRGAIALALSLEVPTPAQPNIFTTTLFIVMVTVFLMGGLTASMLRWLKIDMGPDAGAGGEAEPDVFLHKFDYGTYFKNIDDKYMKRWFLRRNMPSHTPHYGHVETGQATMDKTTSLELTHMEEEHQPVALEEDHDEVPLRSDEQ